MLVGGNLHFPITVFIVCVPNNEFRLEIYIFDYMNILLFYLETLNY